MIGCFERHFNRPVAEMLEQSEDRTACEPHAGFCSTAAEATPAKCLLVRLLDELIAIVADHTLLESTELMLEPLESFE